MDFQMRDSFILQGPVDFETTENPAVTIQPESSLLSHNIDDSLSGFSVTLFIMHWTDVTILANPPFPSSIFP